MRPPRTFVIALASLLALGALWAPATATARGKTLTEPASTSAFFGLRGTNGWHFTVIANGRSRVGRNIFIFGSKRGQGQISYSVDGRVSEDGTIEAKLPGIGRIDVDFEATASNPPDGRPGPGCVLHGESSDQSGWFRGTIELHGEGGYSSVSRSSVHGQLSKTAAETCPKTAARHLTAKQRKDAYPPAVLLAGRRFHGGLLRLEAVSLEGWKDSGRAVEPPREFAATYERHRDGVAVTASNFVDGSPSEFASSAAEGSLSDATVEPPAPFSGSASFHLVSPEKASWTGDLAVELPTLGKVSLVGPRTWSILCAKSDCTKTGPDHFGFSFSWSVTTPSGDMVTGVAAVAKNG